MTISIKVSTFNHTAQVDFIDKDNKVYRSQMLKGDQEFCSFWGGI